jgi:hypothetical protein
MSLKRIGFIGYDGVQALDLGHEAVWMLQLTIEQLNPVAGKAPSEATGYLPKP